MTHTISFPVRYYECDPYNHVNHANYIRYMGEAAFSASTMVGYSDHKLRDSDFVWITREHEIEFLKPYRFGDTVCVQTWVDDFYRVRSRRRYLFLEKSEKEEAHTTRPIAKAVTDWVLTQRSTGKPIRIPDKMAADFMAKNGPPSDIDPLPARIKFPKPAAQPPEVGNIECPVEWRDIDPNGHLNNAAYFSYIENGTLALCDRLGWTTERMAEAGFGIFARRYRLEYLAPADMQTALTLQTWVSDFKRSTAIRHYRLYDKNKGTDIARARCLWVWVDLQKERPIRIPKQFLEDFQQNFSKP